MSYLVPKLLFEISRIEKGLSFFRKRKLKIEEKTYLTIQKINSLLSQSKSPEQSLYLSYQILKNPFSDYAEYLPFLISFVQKFDEHSNEIKKELLVLTIEKLNHALSEYPILKRIYTHNTAGYRSCLMEMLTKSINNTSEEDQKILMGHLEKLKLIN
jgi:hypothetical protein